MEINIMDYLSEKEIGECIKEELKKTNKELYKQSRSRYIYFKYIIYKCI